MRQQLPLLGNHSGAPSSHSPFSLDPGTRSYSALGTPAVVPTPRAAQQLTS